MIRKTSFFARTGNFLAVVGAVTGAAAAVEAHRSPSARHLQVLGIDPAAFRNINR